MAEYTSLVPTFIIYFNGTRLEADREADVKEVLIIDRLDSPSLFSITVADPEKVWLTATDFSEGSEVKILLGYKDDIHELMVGEVTGLACSYRTEQAVRVTIKGSNRLHRLCRNKLTTAFTEMSDKEIIETLAKETGLSTEIEKLDFKHKFTLQHNKTSFEYMLTLAQRYDCHFYAQAKKLIFKRLQNNAGEDLVLEYGKTLIEAFPEVDSSKIISEVEVRGWDNTRGEPVSGTAVWTDIDSPGGAAVADNWGTAKELYLDQAVPDTETASKLALDLLTRGTRPFIAGKGRTEGNPAIRAGTIIKLNGLGKKLSGKYFITAARHHLNLAAGYVTEFVFTSTIASGNGADSSTVVTAETGSQSKTSRQESASNQEDQTTATTTQDKQLHPSFSNLQWQQNNTSVTKAYVGDKVLMSATVTDIEDGTWVKATIYEKDYDNENDYIGRYSAQVKNGRIELAWEVEYYEDRDDRSGTAEEQEQGYTLPEYIFILDATQPQQVTSAESPLLEVYAHFVYKVVDYAGNPITDKKYCLILADGSKKTGRTDNEGFIVENDVLIGVTEIIL